MRGIDSKCTEICFNRAFMAENSDPKNETNLCLPRVASRVVYAVYIHRDNVDIGRIFGREGERKRRNRW